MPNEAPFIFVYIFLVISGAIAIIAAIVKICNPSSSSGVSPDSSIETKWFKFNAPAGIVYGIIAIFSVIFIVKYDNRYKYREIIYKLRQEVLSLQKENRSLKQKLAIKSPEEGWSTFKANISSIEPLSLFNATVLVTYDYNVFSKSTLEFKGIKGISAVPDGKYISKKIEFSVGDRFFIKLLSYEIWGVNVLGEVGGATLEFFKVNHSKNK